MEEIVARLLVNYASRFIDKEKQGYIDGIESFCKVNAFVILSHLAGIVDDLPDDNKHFVIEQYNNLRYV